MKFLNSLALTLLPSAAMSLVVHDLRDGQHHHSNLEARNSYELGMNIFDQGSCGGAHVATRNHDEHSCNADTTPDGFVMRSARVKSDGKANGYGCMTVFQGTDCKQTPSQPAQVFRLGADNCIDFAWDAGCVVVSSIEDGGTCTLMGPSCS
ncbi:hypothetical protein M426DRAFT_317618 [Hypoxylon sp. CI-4A]|nr:hypothetical protein M426DRAFT_317618 [Hypoxylon sp. CI-4A]